MRLVTSFVFTLLFVGCVSTNVTTTLRVVLYPDIPTTSDGTNKAMAARIKREFEAAHRGIDLQLVPFESSGDLYDATHVAALLNGESDVVELDTLMLGELLVHDAVRSWPAAPKRSWNRSVAPLVDAPGGPIAIPHWLCGYYVMTRDRDVAAAASGAAFRSALERAAATPPRISGNFRGATTLTAIYLDAWRNIHPTGDIDSAMNPENLDGAVETELKSLIAECGTSTNPCWDKTWKDAGNDKALAAFGSGDTAAYVGYSENLSRLHDLSKVSVHSLRFGDTSAPVVYSDALVLRKGCDGACAKAALAFADYLTNRETYRWMMLRSDDLAATTPRYLLAANDDAYRSHGISDDRLYAALRRETANATLLPIWTFNAKKDAIKAKLEEAVKP
jgi:thiamine pyridinylase